jgi:hypothetical protein
VSLHFDDLPSLSAMVNQDTFWEFGTTGLGVEQRLAYS